MIHTTRPRKRIKTKRSYPPALLISCSAHSWARKEIKRTEARAFYCAVGRLGAVRPAFKSFQLRIALKPRKNVPCVCQRQ